MSASNKYERTEKSRSIKNEKRAQSSASSNTRRKEEKTKKDKTVFFSDRPKNFIAFLLPPVKVQSNSDNVLLLVDVESVN